MAVTAWSGDWGERIRERTRSLGCNSISEFLGMFPTESYVEVAKRLGEDVAARHLEHMQLVEAQERGCEREAAKDSLVRVLNEHNRKGWGVGLHAKRRSAHACAKWVTMTPINVSIEESSIVRERVWNALESLNPPHGWVPSSISDTILNEAFEKGWPSA